MLLSLYNLHIAAFLIHFVSTVLSLFVHIDQAKTAILQPTHNFNTNNYTVTTSKELFEVHPLWLISINEALTCISHGIALYLLSGLQEKRKINNLETLRRSYEYMLTAGILQCALVLGVGSAYLHDVVFLLVINVVIQLLGVAIDMGEKGTGQTWNYIMAFTLLVAEIIYVLLHCLSLDTPDAFERTYFFLMGAVYGILYLLFGVVKLYIPNAMKANKVYVALSVTTKVILSWILVGNTHYGFMQLFSPVPEQVIEMDWPLAIGLLTSILLVILGVIVFYIVNEDEDVEPPKARLKYKRIDLHVQ
jgi:hypothetical protein